MEKVLNSIVMNKLYVLIVIFNTLYNKGNCSALPEDIQKCHFGDSQCIAKSINDIIKRYPKGIPEIGLPPLDEIKIYNFTILDSPKRGPIWLHFQMRDNVNKGFNNATITHVEGFDRNPNKKKIVVHARVPRITHDASYDMEGKFLLFKANTTGSLHSDFQNLSLILSFKVIVEYHHNKRYLKIYDVVPLITIDRWIIWLNDLYTENTDLTVALNRAFNDNWLEFWNGMEPALIGCFTRSVTGLLNKVFETVAYDDMFLPSFDESQ